MSTQFVTTQVTRFDAAKNVFVPETKFTAIEVCFDLRLNGKSFRQLYCSPADIEDLTVGVLAQAGEISTVDDLTNLDVDAANFAVDVETSTVDVTNLDVDAQISTVDAVRFSAKKILACADKLLGELSVTHAKTNGVHSGLLFDGDKILFVREDIGRHNVFDKIHGAALRQRINLRDKALIFSGRCSAEMVHKVHRMKIPVVAAKSVPTTEAVNLARKFGITLAARLSAGSFCVYTNPRRIVL